MIKIEWLSFITGFSVATVLFVAYNIVEFLREYNDE